MPYGELSITLSLQLFFVFVSFFGTGNIASISSFDPTSVRCFVNIFRPWVMMVVLLVKILGPFLLVSCFFRRLMSSSMQVQQNFLIVLLFCQGMTLHMFFQVTNQGSWLQIGTSISHFVIVQVTALFLFVLHIFANIMISTEFVKSKTKYYFDDNNSLRQSKGLKVF